MTNPIAQDFERYAATKPMSGSVAETWLRPFRESVLARIPDIAQAQALDYGFGDGRFFDVLSAHFAADHVHGVEVSQMRTDRARARGWANARYVPAGASLPYRDGMFAFVNMYEVIEHVPLAVVDGCLAEITRVLTDDGTLLLTTPNYPMKRVYDVMDAVKLRQWKRLRDDPTHVAFYSHSRLHRALEPYFESVTVSPFKAGLFYARTGWPPLCHKLIAVCHRPRRGAAR